MKEPNDRRLSPPTMEQFKEFVRKVIAVPKKEIDKRESEYKRRRKDRGHQQ